MQVDMNGGMKVGKEGKEDKDDGEHKDNKEVAQEGEPGRQEDKVGSREVGVGRCLLEKTGGGGPRRPFV
jgi:hypothetical protein